MRRATTTSRVSRTVSGHPNKPLRDGDRRLTYAVDDNEANLTVSNTVSNTHTYTFDWTPDSLTWYIDGNAMRTKNRNDTWNSTTNQYHYPQSPARIELSLWPAGLSSNGEGTVDWSGGLVDWNSQYMQNGYYYAKVTDVNVECYDPPSDFDLNHGNKAYYYTTTYGTNDTVAIGNNNTELASFYATGDNASKDPNASASASASASTGSASASATPNTVPGVSGGGNLGNSGGTANSGSSGSDSGSGSTGSSGSGGGSQGGGSTSFQQGVDSSGGSGTSQAPPRAVAGSAVALLGFFVACLVM